MNGSGSPMEKVPVKDSFVTALMSGARERALVALAEAIAGLACFTPDETRLGSAMNHPDAGRVLALVSYILSHAMPWDEMTEQDAQAFVAELLRFDDDDKLHVEWGMQKALALSGLPCPHCSYWEAIEYPAPPDITDSDCPRCGRSRSHILAMFADVLRNLDPAGCIRLVDFDTELGAALREQLPTTDELIVLQSYTSTRVPQAGLDTPHEQWEVASALVIDQRAEIIHMTDLENGECQIDSYQYGEDERPLVSAALNASGLA